jgi:hypothetical protein
MIILRCSRSDAVAGECLVVGRVGDGCELLAEAERLHPDVIVLDITTPRLDGIEAPRQQGVRSGLLASSFSRSTKTPTTPGPHSMRAGSLTLLRRGSPLISSLPYGPATAHLGTTFGRTTPNSILSRMVPTQALRSPSSRFPRNPRARGKPNNAMQNQRS